MNYRLTIAAAAAVILASISEGALISGGAWLVEASGAVLIVALAGTLTRLSPVPAAAGAALLGAAASAPLFVAQSPYLKAAGAVIIACCAASASGLRPLRTVAGAVTYLAALLLYVNVLLAPRRSFYAVIPTGKSLRYLTHLAQQGSALAKYSPPVPGTHGVLILCVGSIGLAAIAVDFIAVRLRKPAIAGLPLLVLYMAPIATTAHVGGPGSIVAFLLAAAGYLALLSSDGRSRLRGWGRVVTVWHYSGEDERLGGADVGTLAATGRRIGLAAVCAAVVAPLLLPSLNLHRLFAGNSGGGQPVAVGLPDPVDQLQHMLTQTSSQPVLTYRTNAADSGNYLQVYVLNYDSAQGLWDLVRPARSTAVGSRALRQAPGLTLGTPQRIVRTQITLGQVAGYSWRIFFLPAPYWPIRVHVSGAWRESDGTLMIYSYDPNHQGQRYTVTSGDVVPAPAQLEAPQQIPAAIRRSYLGFRTPLAGQLRTIAEHITKGRTTAFARAVALERWFQSGRFTYNLRSTNTPNTAQGLLAFLTTNRQGYCQQFAFAMAVLARLLGIPARVAIGYTAGTARANGNWVVATSDAHAWPELYFSGIGWLRFEPTPGGSSGQSTAVQPSYVISAVTGRQQPGPGQGGGPSTSSSARPTGIAIPARKLQAPEGQGGLPVLIPTHNIAGPVELAVLVLLLLAAAAPGTARLAARRRHWRSARDDKMLAWAAWQELCADLDDYGLACRPSESPRAVARRVRSATDVDEQASQAVGRIATVVERARYAPVPDPAGAIRSDVTLVRRSLARSAGPAARWRARLLPASTLRPLRGAVRQGLGLLTGWMPAQGEGAAS